LSACRPSTPSPSRSAAASRPGLAHATDDPAWLAAQVWAALHGLVLLRLNAPGFPWPAPVEQLADQAVTRLVQLELDPPAPDHPTGRLVDGPSRHGATS
jgi:hypothetical protein